MRTRVLLMVFVLCFSQAYGLINTEELPVNEREYDIADFTEIRLGMAYHEVVALLGMPTYSFGSGITWDTYKLSDGWCVDLLFMGEDRVLIDIVIVDHNNDRRFRLITLD